MTRALIVVAWIQLETLWVILMIVVWMNSPRGKRIE